MKIINERKQMGKGGFVATIVVALTLMLTGCGDANETSSDVKTVGQVTESGISSDRCEANRKVGEITYLTSFDYAASASIVDVVVAKELGYFEKMCLNVKLQPGFSTDNIPVVSDGKVQFTSVGSMSEVAGAVDKQAKIKAIATYGHTAIEALAVSEKSGIDSIAKVQGSTMGVLGSIPYSVRLMLTRGGVSLDSIKQVQVPFDATLLDKGDFASRPVYKSSEPRQLDAANIKYRLFEPGTQNIPASFGTMIVNNSFAEQHPTVVEDFLRADLQGFRYALDHPKEAAELAQKRSDPKYYLTSDGEEFRWAIESKLVRESTPAGKNYGYIDRSEVEAETAPLASELKAISSNVDAGSIFDMRYFDAIHSGNELVWPKG